MFRSPKKNTPKPTSGQQPGSASAGGMGRRETSIWLGRALSSDQVVLQSVLQLVHIIEAQQQVILALVRQQSGQLLEPDQTEALQQMDGQGGEDVLKRLSMLEAELEPVLKAVEQACATLEKEIR